MKVFLTGATGHIGSAVLDGLLRSGHDVTALVRDREKAERVERRGVVPVVGDLAIPDSYSAAAQTCDGAIHAGSESSKRREEVDRGAIDVLLKAMQRAKGRDGRPPFLIYTSGVWVLGKATKPATEDTPTNPTAVVSWLPAHERMVLEAGADGAVRTAVVRPGTVYGGGRGIIADLVKEASNGLVRVVGSGRQHWPCVYDRDLADLYVRLVARDDTSGVYHANDEADERAIEIVDAISAYFTRPPDVRCVPFVEARAKLGDYADALALDQRVRSPRARQIGWAPSLQSVRGSVARLLEEFRSARPAA